MPSLTRRQLLATTSGGLALLAGCAGSETAHREVPGSNDRVVEHEFVKARSVSEPNLFWSGERQDSSENEQRLRIGREYLATAPEAEDVEFAATEGGDRLRAFVSETDFETESVFLWASGVSECHEIHLQQATVAEDGDPHLDFCQTVRPADHACSEDVVHTVAYAVRFPTDGREATGSGSGMSHRCSDPASRSTFDTTVTVQEGDGE